MSYKSPSPMSRQSRLGKAAYSSLTPMQAYSAGLSKYKYLSDNSNRNQSIMKEIVNTETRIAKNWKTNTALLGNLFAPKQRHDMQSSIRENLQKIRKTSNDFSRALNDSRFLKNNIRTSSYDPILGLKNEYFTPNHYFQVFGSNPADFYRSNAFYRRND